MADPFFRIEMMPAKHGDALLVEYGTRQTRRLVIDGGPLSAYPLIEARLDRLPEGDRGVELLVITHVDTDHVEGVIRLLAMPESKWPFSVDEIWFNGWRHIEEARDLGGREGEFVSALISRRAGDRWNTRFERKAVRVGAVPDDRVKLEDGMVLTVLSPTAEALAALLKAWKKSAKEWEIEPGHLDQAWQQLVDENKFHPGAELTLGPDDLTAKLRKQLTGGDDSTANGSSIAFLAEYAGKRALLLGDAHMDVVCGALEARGHTKEKPLRMDAVKMAHHGSRNNLTPRFLELVDAAHWLVSTNGDKFEHPDAAAIEAVIAGARRKPTLWFNYRSKFNQRWEAPSLRPGARYATRYPETNDAGMTVSL